MSHFKKISMLCVLLLLFFCSCKKADGFEGQPIAPEPSPTPTPAPGAWFWEPAKNQEFDWTASSYDYACYIMELKTEENKVIINPVRWIFEFEEERWFAEGNQEPLTGYDVLDEEIDPVELTITEKTEFHMDPHPEDYPYSYIKEHCDRYFHGEFVTSDPVLFEYYLQNFTEERTQFFEEGRNNNLVWFVILDTDGTTAYFIEGPRY